MWRWANLLTICLLTCEKLMNGRHISWLQIQVLITCKLPQGKMVPQCPQKICLTTPYSQPRKIYCLLHIYIWILRKPVHTELKEHEEAYAQLCLLEPISHWKLFLSNRPNWVRASPHITCETHSQGSRMLISKLHDQLGMNAVSLILLGCSQITIASFTRVLLNLAW
jgi:hypothetical protein